jgi:ribonuclease H / adenosylcobalamin/alpha-ribazole phosphatase
MLLHKTSGEISRPQLALSSLKALAFLGIATNNVAEYQAVLHAVEWLFMHKELLADDIHISFRLDSNLVVSQMSGSMKIKAPKMQQLAGKVKAHLRQLPGTHTFDHIPREENTYADRLANDILDNGV